MADKPYFAHATAEIDGENESNGFVDPNIGAGTRVWHHAHVMKGAVLGAACNLGQNVFVGATVRMGRNCKLQNNVNVYDGVIMGDHVFCGPSMTFTNLSKPLPRSAIVRHSMYQETHVADHASIGAGAVIVCGHDLGTACFVAAGAVVIRDVPAYALVAGNPANRVGWVCRCGERLRGLEGGAETETCQATYEVNGETVVCGRSYRRQDTETVVLENDPHERGD